MGDLVFGLPIDVKRLLWLLDGGGKSAACLSFWKTQTLGGRTTRSEGPQPRSGNVDDQSWMLSFVCTRIGEQEDLLLPAWATSSFTTVAGQGWLAGRKALS
jgi:hypothetical protein